MTSFARQGSALIYTRKNQVGFVNVADGALGPAFCAASHETEIVSAQTDYSSSVFVYGLALKTREIYVFRTSNLLSTAYALKCEVETKIPLLDTQVL